MFYLKRRCIVETHKTNELNMYQLLNLFKELDKESFFEYSIFLYGVIK